MGHKVGLAAAAASALAIAAAVQADDGFRPVSKGNAWTINQTSCAIDVSWPDNSGVGIGRHENHHDMSLFNPRFKGVVSNTLVRVRVSAGEPVNALDEVEVSGLREGETLSYTASVFDDLFDRIAASGVLRMYRGNALIADFKMAGFAEALTAMRDCEVRQPMPDSNEQMDAAMNATDAAMSADDIMENAADAAPSAEPK